MYLHIIFVTDILTHLLFIIYILINIIFKIVEKQSI